MKNFFKKTHAKNFSSDSHEQKKTEDILEHIKITPRTPFQQELENKIITSMKQETPTPSQNKTTLTWKKLSLVFVPILILLSFRFVQTDFVSAQLNQIISSGKKLFLNEEMGGDPVQTTDKKMNVPIKFIFPTNHDHITQYFSHEDPKHVGIDFNGKLNDQIVAIAEGTIEAAECGWNGGYGCYIIIDHKKNIKSVYGHINEIFVKPGENVSQGQKIATIGSTGYGTGGPFLHFEIRVNDIAVDPLHYLE